MSFRIRNWEKFQHFKDRRPPWIKLYRDLLDDIEWHDLDPFAAKVLVMLWLIASEDDGELPELRKLAFRLRMSESDVKQALKNLSIWVIQDDINVISDEYQDDDEAIALARSRETETETETEDRSSADDRSRFHEFWLAYPKKVKKKPARDKWKSKRLDSKADEIIADIRERQQRDKRWLDGYVPDPTTYLTQERWEDEIETKRVVSGPQEAELPAGEAY